MSQEWAERQRSTNKLVRALAGLVLSQPDLSARQLYGLCKLTWITTSHSGPDAAYIRSTKIPALGDAVGKDYSGRSLSEVAKDISKILGYSEVEKLVLEDTGFTDFYKAYRNSSLGWLESNFDVVLPMFRAAFGLTSDKEGESLIRQIESLPGIPKPNHPEQAMRPEFLLTPVYFALDKRIRFPLINGNDGVKALLKALHVVDASLDVQFKAMIDLYGQGRISDAADLDQVGHNLPDFISRKGEGPTKSLLGEKPTEGSELSLKDESDIETLQKAVSRTSKRKHNWMTNKVRDLLTSYTLLEGTSKDALFDVQVVNYNCEGDDLLIEVKSETEVANIRMAVGQLFDYWFHVKGKVKPHIAIMLPSIPELKISEMLEWLNIGVLWIEENSLQTTSPWLHCLTERHNV